MLAAHADRGLDLGSRRPGAGKAGRRQRRAARALQCRRTVAMPRPLEPRPAGHSGAHGRPGGVPHEPTGSTRRSIAPPDRPHPILAACRELVRVPAGRAKSRGRCRAAVHRIRGVDSECTGIRCRVAHARPRHALDGPGDPRGIVAEALNLHRSEPIRCAPGPAGTADRTVPRPADRPLASRKAVRTAPVQAGRQRPPGHPAPAASAPA